MAAARCCPCNGVKAKCVRCVCAKRKKPCISCIPGRSNSCQNSLSCRQIASSSGQMASQCKAVVSGPSKGGSLVQDFVTVGSSVGCIPQSAVNGDSIVISKVSSVSVHGDGHQLESDAVSSNDNTLDVESFDCLMQRAYGESLINGGGEDLSDIWFTEVLDACSSFKWYAL